MIPTLLFAAPSTGSGKTTALCAVAAALRARGRDVRTFKVGPDYLDPTWHRVVTGRSARNLDGWMTGAAGVAASFARGAAGGDVALIEGVMGLFDGRSPTSLEGSAAEIAIWLGAPVVLVVDAGGMARTAAAVVEGLARHVPEVRVAGVIFNRAPHERLLREAMAPTGIPVLGALPSRPDLAVPERHLGLVSGELAAKPGWVEALAAFAEAHLDLDALVSLARVAPTVAPAPPLACEGRRVRIAVARDAAFHFYYDDNLDLLEQAGADLVPFSPLSDPALPAADGLYLGGGYPEAHADALAANTSMRASIRAFRGPVYAECGGFMYLGESLDGVPMCGVLPTRTRMGPALRSFGYREVVTTADTVLGPAGTRFRGHEFHYSELDGAPPLRTAYRASGWSGEADEGWARGRVLGSYIHAHFGSNPQLAAHFVDACRA